MGKVISDKVSRRRTIIKALAITMLAFLALVCVASAIQDSIDWNNRENILNKDFSFESYNYRGEFIRHANFLGERTPITSQLDRMDSTFALRSGLADQNEVSFESYNYPGYFLRHQDYRL